MVCSGYPGMKDDMELKFYNIAGFIEKPVNPEEFEKQIALALPWLTNNLFSER